MSLPVIRTRDDLLSMLAEASELEHNIMCLYLYAAFSLKNSEAEDISLKELETIGRWRKQIMTVCVQEMTHLAIVSNLMTSVGGRAHFFRTAFPIRSGYFPADFVMNLEPFTLQSLKHFIYLERSTDDVEDVEDSVDRDDYTRGAPKGRLMSHGGDYATVGELYSAIAKGIEYLASQTSNEELFCGSHNLQLKDSEIHVKELKLIRDRASAIASLDIIVEQGEGSKKAEGSHLEMFRAIRKEYQALLKANPGFKPARPCASNPIMRRPAETDADEDNLIWISYPKSAKYLDLANAIYDLMLRVLIQIYSNETRTEEARAKLLNSVFEFMKALSIAGSYLAELPAKAGDSTVNAGISFAINRHLAAVEQRSELLLLKERLRSIIAQLQDLRGDGHTSKLVEGAVIERIEACLNKALNAWA